MFSLIVTIISIVLVAVLAIATIWYGGSIYTSQKASIEASGLANQASQIYAAAQMYKQDNGAWPANPQILVDTDYLKALPIPSQGALHATASQTGYGGISGKAYAQGVGSTAKMAVFRSQRNQNAWEWSQEVARSWMATPYTADINDHTSVIFAPVVENQSAMTNIGTWLYSATFTLNGVAYDITQLQASGLNFYTHWDGSGRLALTANNSTGFALWNTAGLNTFSVAYTFNEVPLINNFEFTISDTAPLACSSGLLPYQSGTPSETCVCPLTVNPPASYAGGICPVVHNKTWGTVGLKNGEWQSTAGNPVKFSQLVGEGFGLMPEVGKVYSDYGSKTVYLNGLNITSQSYASFDYCGSDLCFKVWPATEELLIEGANSIRVTGEFLDNNLGQAVLLDIQGVVEARAQNPAMALALTGAVDWTDGENQMPLFISKAFSKGGATLTFTGNAESAPYGTQSHGTYNWYSPPAIILNGVGVAGWIETGWNDVWPTMNLNLEQGVGQNFVQGTNILTVSGDAYNWFSNTWEYAVFTATFSAQLQAPARVLNASVIDGYISGTSGNGNWTGTMPWGAIQETQASTVSLWLSPLDPLTTIYFQTGILNSGASSITLNGNDISNSEWYKSTQDGCSWNYDCLYLELSPAGIKAHGIAGANSLVFNSIDNDGTPIRFTITFDMDGGNSGGTGGGGVTCPAGQHAGEGNTCRCTGSNSIPDPILGCSVQPNCPVGQHPDSASVCVCDATNALPNGGSCEQVTTCPTGQYASGNACLCTSNNQTPDGTWGCTDSPSGPTGSCPANQFYHNGQCLCRSTTEAPVNGACPLPPEYTKPAPQWGFVFNSRGDLQYIVLQEVVGESTCGAVDRANTGRSLLLSPFEKVSIGTGINPKLTYQCVDSVVVTVGEIRPSQAGYTYYWMAPGAGNSCDGIPQLRTALGTESLYCTETPSCPAGQYLGSDNTTCLCNSSGQAPDTLTGACGVPQCTANQHWNPIDRICVNNAVCPAGQAVTPQNTCACLSSGLPPSGGVCPAPSELVIQVGSHTIFGSGMYNREEFNGYEQSGVLPRELFVPSIPEDEIVLVGDNPYSGERDIMARYLRAGTNLYQLATPSYIPVIGGLGLGTFARGGWPDSAVLIARSFDVVAVAGSNSRSLSSPMYGITVRIEFAPELANKFSANYGGVDLGLWESASTIDYMTVQLTPTLHTDTLGGVKTPAYFRLPQGSTQADWRIGHNDPAQQNPLVTRPGYGVGIYDPNRIIDNVMTQSLDRGLTDAVPVGTGAVMADTVSMGWNPAKTTYRVKNGYAVGFVENKVHNRANATVAGFAQGKVYPDGSRGRSHVWGGSVRYCEELDLWSSTGCGSPTPAACPSVDDEITVRLFDSGGSTDKILFKNAPITASSQAYPLNYDTEWIAILGTIGQGHLVKGSSESSGDVRITAPSLPNVGGNTAYWNSRFTGIKYMVLASTNGTTNEFDTYRNGLPIRLCEIPTCNFNGFPVEKGASVLAYQASMGNPNCMAEIRTCGVTNGVASLSGSFEASSCTPGGSGGGGGGGTSCTIDGQSIADGQTVQAFASATAVSCVPLNRTCNNGVLSGAGEFLNCTETGGGGGGTPEAFTISAFDNCSSSNTGVGCAQGITLPLCDFFGGNVNSLLAWPGFDYAAAGQATGFYGEPSNPTRWKQVDYLPAGLNGAFTPLFNYGMSGVGGAPGGHRSLCLADTTLATKVTCTATAHPTVPTNMAKTLICTYQP